MRKLVLSIVVLGIALTAAPAGAGHAPAKPITWRNANLSCAVACPYWIDDANTDLDGDGGADIYHQACEQPELIDHSAAAATHGSGKTYWEDFRLTITTAAEFLTVRITPEVDWDSFICSTSGEELAIGANILGENCDNPLGNDSPVPAGCYEEIIIPVIPNKTYLLRAFNWSDTPATVRPLQGSYELHSL